MTAIDDKINELTRRKVVLEDKVDFMNWMFEYACRTLEYEKKDPKIEYKQIPRLINKKMDGILRIADKLYWDYPEYNHFIMKTPEYNQINKLIRAEHSK